MRKLVVFSFLALCLILSTRPVRAQACEGAVAAFKSGQMERAAQLARQCINEGAVSSDAYKLLAIASYFLQRSEDYLVNMQKAAELNPVDPEIHYHLGRFYYEVKQYTQAMDRFNKTIGLDPNNHKARYFLALCKQGNSDEPGAIEEYKKAITIIERKHVSFGWAFADLGDLLTLKGDYEAGVSWGYRGTRNDPSQPYVHFIYARILMNKEPTPEIEQELNKAIELDPGYTQAYYQLGRYYTKIGDRERAKIAFAKFNELQNNPVPSPHGVRRQ